MYLYACTCVICMYGCMCVFVCRPMYIPVYVHVGVCIGLYACM